MEEKGEKKKNSNNDNYKIINLIKRKKIYIFI